VHLLYLFGKLSSGPTFAIHDEDVLEYAHNVITHGDNVLNRLLGELKQRTLLFIGCNFPDWLSRFFLRVTNAERLSKKDKREWMIEQPGPEESLTSFLRSHSKATEILTDTSPVEFVGELYRRWVAECNVARPAVATPQAEGVPTGAMFFISYSRGTDQPRAEAMVKALLKLGVAESDVWFDRAAIEPGQDFRERILEGIRGCRYFLPLLSKAANDRDEAFVFTEWNAANDRLNGMNREFIIPIMLDAECCPESYTAKPVKKWRDLHFGRAPDGQPDDLTAALLLKLVRTTRSSAGVVHD